MTSSIPKVSVCLPAYNSEKFIGLAIESVLSQTFTDFELILSDDCSTDATLEIAKKYRDSRIRILENEINLGMEGNWNKSVKAARGKFIKLLCNDDVLYPKCLEAQVAILEDSLNKDVVLVSCQRDIIDSNGKKLLSRGQKLKGKVDGKKVIKKSIRAGTNIIGEPTSVMFRSELLKSIGFFKQSIPYLIDLDLWGRLLLKGYAYMIPEALCVFRVSTVSASVGMAKSQSKDFSDFIDKLYSDPEYQLSSFDKMQGKVMARINSLMRQIFYKFTVPRNEATS